jgi:hypothetical protein
VAGDAVLDRILSHRPAARLGLRPQGSRVAFVARLVIVVAAIFVLAALEGRLALERRTRMSETIRSDTLAVFYNGGSNRGSE